MSYLLSIDTSITNKLSTIVPHNNFFNIVFAFFSLVGGSIVWWIIAAILLFIYEEHRNHKFISYFIGSFATVYVIVNIILKNIFMRQRPILTDFNRLQLISTVCPSDFSFPSTHAATAFAAATTLSFFDPKRKYVYYFIALIVSYSRIYLGCHFVIDTIVGGLLGWLISKIILLSYVSYKKKRPSVHKK